MEVCGCPLGSGSGEDMDGFLDVAWILAIDGKSCRITSRMYQLGLFKHREFSAERDMRGSFDSPETIYSRQSSDSE